MEAIKNAEGTYGRFDEAVKTIDPREEQEEQLMITFENYKHKYKMDEEQARSSSKIRQSK